MHPGNIFVDATSPETPTYIAIDCAIVGQLSRGDQYYVARNLLAILQRNYRLVAELHIESGWVPSSTRVQDFEATIRMLCEPILIGHCIKFRWGTCWLICSGPRPLST